jgi:hypothetical protein
MARTATITARTFVDRTHEWPYPAVPQGAHV